MARGGLDLQPGVWLDRYELLLPIGRGGMASVWVARLHGKRGFEKLVAIKTFLPDQAELHDVEQMFLDEARIVAGIRHPHVAAILDVGEHQGFLYLAFEWVDGEHLSKLRKAVLKKGREFPSGIALRIMADVAAGLHAAHELRDAEGQPLDIVHRDISPQNIMVSLAGGVKVIDFGIAKTMFRLQATTAVGKIKGKTPYIAPEIVRGEGIDRRVDIWAAGVILYELLTHRLPYPKSGRLDALMRLATGSAPDPLPFSVPGPIASVVERALCVDRSARYQTAAELQRGIEAALVKVGGLITSSDVAGFAAEHLEEHTRAKRSRIAKAQEAAARGEFEEPSMVSEPGSISSISSISSSAAVVVPNGPPALLSALSRASGGPESQGPESQVAPPESASLRPRSRRGLYALFAIIAVVLLAGVTIVLRGPALRGLIPSQLAAEPVLGAASGVALPTTSEPAAERASDPIVEGAGSTTAAASAPEPLASASSSATSDSEDKEVPKTKRRWPAKKDPRDVFGSRK